MSRGQDSNGVLQIDIIITGQLPSLPDTARVTVLPYSDDYVQAGQGEMRENDIIRFETNCNHKDTSAM